MNTVLKYGIKTTCGTKQELPFVDPDVYICGFYRMQSVDEIEQVRIPAGIFTSTEHCINTVLTPSTTGRCEVYYYTR